MVMPRRVPLHTSKLELVCRGCCQGATALVISEFSSEFKLVLECPRCLSNWTLIPDGWNEVHNKWQSQVDRDQAHVS